MQKKIVVTGGAGFIGSHLSEKLLTLGHDVSIIDDFNDFYDPTIKRKNIESISSDKNFHLYEADITDPAVMKKILSEIRPQIVVHLAARAGVRPSLENPSLYAKVNIVGTLNILEALKGIPVENFIFGSSSSVYGNSPRVPFSEDDPCDEMISPYAVTKRSAELLCEMYAHNEKIPVTCLRFFTVYGPRQRPDLAIHSFMKKILKGESIDMFGDGSSARDYTYVDDIVAGIIRTIDTPQSFEIINLGNSHPVLLRDMIAEIEKATDKKANTHQKPFQKGDVNQTYANISKAKKLLNWEPRVPFSQGITRMVQWIHNA